MDCPKCLAVVPDSSKFCLECGSPVTASGLASAMDADRSSLLQSYIPAELAKRILSAGAQIESERRLVTVVFADVSGFTAMSEKLDAEDVSSVLNDCFKGLISIVYKYEGVIDKFIGDEIMAIFGAPLAHENDAERAVRCSIEMIEYMERFNLLSPVALPEPLGLHISMNTGMVVAGNVGSDLRMNYSVIGDTVNLASRLNHIAERGEIVISEDTFRIVSSLVNTEEPLQVEVKGKSKPVKVYKVASMKGGIEPGTRVTQKSPIVGRDQEIGQLQMAMSQMLQKREQRLFIRGEAGVGKTRLKLELVEHARSAGITTYEGKCSSFEINTPYYLWTTLLKDILQLKADTVESEARKRLHDMLQILSLEKQEPYLATLLSLRYEEILLEEDQERKKKIYDSLKEFIRALSKRKPFVFLLEDVHWIDRFSQDLLNYLFAEQELAPAMFVPLFRDEYVHSKELIEKGGTLIDLNRLTKPAAQKLMCARLNVDDVPANLADLIYKRSEGNPFFIEELIKTLIDRNVVALKKQKLEILKTDFESILPATVQGVIMARIDRLEEKLKDVLYGASVIGREFDKTLLKEILKKKETVDPSLNELLTLELILEKEEAKELAYLFKHYLIQEVAYNTLLQKKRKELHKLIAQAIEKVYADKLKDFYELLSFHYEKAEEWEKAADYLSRAGRKMSETFTQEESKEFVERKEVALEQLFASEAEKSSFFLKILSVVTLGAAIVIGSFLVVGGAYMEFVATFTKPDNQIPPYSIRLMIVLTGISFIYISFALRKTLSALGQIRLYEIMDDGISLVFTKGQRVVIPFSDVQSVSYVPREQKGKGFWARSWEDTRKAWTLLGIYHQPIFGGLRLIAATSPLFAAPGKEGFIYLRKKKGISVFRAQMTIVSNKLKMLKGVRNIGLAPVYTSQFYDQLVIALAKWRNKHCPHCSTIYKPFGDCPSCGYTPGLDLRTSNGLGVGKTTVRPVQNVVLDCLELFINPQVLLGLLIIYGSFVAAHTHLWVAIGFGTLGLTTVLFPLCIQIFKRKFENNLTVEITQNWIAFCGEIPFLKELRIVFLNILSIRRYSNPWQRLFGLANIQIEMREGLPYDRTGPIYHMVIPNIRAGKDLEELLKEKCVYATTKN